MSPRRSSKPRRLRIPDSAWLGVVPTLLFCLAFETVPVILLVRVSLSIKLGEFKLMNYRTIAPPLCLRSFWNSICLSTITTFLGTLFGPLIGNAIFRTPVQRCLIWRPQPSGRGNI